MYLSVICNIKCENNLKRITAVVLFNISFTLKHSLLFITNYFRCFVCKKVLTNYTHKYRKERSIPFTS